MMMKGRSQTYVLVMLCMLWLILVVVSTGGLAETWSVSPPEDYFDSVSKEITQWDTLGEAYEKIFSSWFAGEVRIYGWESLPQRRPSVQTGNVYYNYVDFMTFVFPKGHEPGVLSFNVWGHSNAWESAEVYFTTSEGEVKSDIIGMTRGESVWSIRKEYKPIYGPCAPVYIPVSEDTRFIWIYTENPEIAISDICFIEHDIQSKGSEIGIPSGEEAPKEDGADSEVPQSVSDDVGVTYVNEKFGFSVTAPENWQKEDDPDVLLLLRETRTSSAFWVMARQVSEDSDLAQFIRETERTLGYEVMSARDIVIDSISGVEKLYRFVGDNILMKLKMVYVKKGQIVYALVGGTWDLLFPEFETEFDAMISSFAFVDGATNDMTDIDIPLLSTSGITFASSVRGRRDFTRRPGSIFAQGETIHVYTEVSSFRVWRGEDSRLVASISAELKVMDQDDNVVFEDQQEYRTVFADLSAIPAYSFFHFEVLLGEEIPAGRYKVEIQVRDDVSQQTVPVYGWFYVSKA